MTAPRRQGPAGGGASGEVAYVALGRAGRTGTAFLAPHHLEAARRVEKLFERSRLQPRVTHGWTPMPKAPKGAAPTDSLTDAAAEARRQLARLHDILPPDCAGVVIDICGFAKGLQVVETERGWPRRSAKLVLRIALDRLADHLGLAARARGPERERIGTWREEGARPSEWG